MLATPPPPADMAVVQACGPDCVAAVTPAEMLRLADDYRAKGRIAAADALLRALFANPNADVRLEARFRYARSLIARQRYAEAIEQLDRILAERPSAGPVRFELARALELSGDHARSLREFARLRSGALPPDLAREIDRVISTLRSARPFGGSIEVGIAPDSNVNGATSASTIIINGLPFQLDPSARRKSGLGLEGAGQVYWRHPLGGDTRLVVDAIARGTVYRDPDLDDGTVQLSIGPEFGNRLRPSLLVARRWYLGRGYSWSYGGNAQWLKPISRKTVLDLGARVERVEVQRSTALDGTSYAASIALEHALRPSLFARASISANRYDARSPAFASTSAGTTFLIAKDFGPASIYAQAGYSHLATDGLFLGRKRTDDRIELSGGLSLRRIQLFGASPVVRLTRVINNSTAILYDTSRTRVEFALARPF
jgi:hypothetical protein